MRPIKISIEYWSARFFALFMALWVMDATEAGATEINHQNTGKASQMEICMTHLSQAESYVGIPKDLLRAIALGESGRTDPLSGKFIPWPYTVTIQGNGQFYPNKQAAITAIEQALSKGIRNIDVGCMQINLAYHGDAFDDLEQMIDPIHNIAYAANFLQRLHMRHGKWSEALAYYHSGKLEHQIGYQEKIMRHWLALREDIDHMTMTGLAKGERRDDRAHDRKKNIDKTIDINAIKPAYHSGHNRFDKKVAKYQNAYILENNQSVRARQAALRPKIQSTHKE